MAEKLVHTGYCNGNTSAPIKVYVTYSETVNAAANTSTITCGMRMTVGGGWYIGPWTDFNGSYVGTKSLTFNGNIPSNTASRTLASGKTFTVNHNADGSGSATIYWKWGVNSPWGRVESPSGSFTIPLTKINRSFNAYIRHYKRNAADTAWTHFASTDKTATYGSTVTPAATTVPTGYYFSHYNSWHEGYGTNLGAGSFTMPATNTITEVYYYPNKYYLDLNGSLDGTSTSGVSPMGTADVYVNGTLVADNVTDWYTQYNYGSTYEVKDIKTNAGYTYTGSASYSGTIGTANVGVRPTWTSNNVQIAYHPNGGSYGNGASLNQYGYLVKNGTVWHHNGLHGGSLTLYTAADFGLTKPGHTFAGWTLDYTGEVLTGGASYAVSKLVDRSGKNTSNQAWTGCYVTANWTQNSYKLTINPNGGSWNGSTSAQTFTQKYNTTKVLSEKPTRSGYKFLYWAATTSPTTANFGVNVNTGNAEIPRYRIAKASSTNLEILLYAPNAAVAKCPTWTNTSGQDDLVWHVMNSGSWTRDGYTYNFGLQISIADHNYELLDYITHLYVYNSSGTALTSIGSLNLFDIQLGVGDTYYFHTNNYTLYAIWELDTCTIAYNGNGNKVSNVPNAQTKTIGTNITLSSTKPTRGDRYKFLGWAESSSATSAAYQPGATFTKDVDTTLYAVWQLLDKDIYLYNTGKIDAVDFKTVPAVTDLFDSNGHVYATQFVTHSESNIYIDKNGKIYAKEFIKY